METVIRVARAYTHASINDAKYLSIYYKYAFILDYEFQLRSKDQILFLLLFSTVPAEQTSAQEEDCGDNHQNDWSQKSPDIQEKVLIPSKIMNWWPEVLEAWMSHGVFNPPGGTVQRLVNLSKKDFLEILIWHNCFMNDKNVNDIITIMGWGQKVTKNGCRWIQIKFS